MIAVTAFVCFVERGQRKIPVNYAKRQVGNKVTAAELAPAVQAQHVGRHPAHFRLPVLFRPRCSPGWLAGFVWLRDLSGSLSPQPVYVPLYAALIVFFCFYTALQYNLKETADN